MYSADLKPYILHKNVKKKNTPLLLNKKLSRNQQSKKDHQCKKCTQSFSSEYQLRKHMFIHTGMILYKCDVLSSKENSYQRKSILLCVICKKSFSQRSQLNTHKSIHSRENHICAMNVKKRSQQTAN